MSLWLVENNQRLKYELIFEIGVYWSRANLLRYAMPDA